MTHALRGTPFSSPVVDVLHYSQFIMDGSGRLDTGLPGLLANPSKGERIAPGGNATYEVGIMSGDRRESFALFPSTHHSATICGGYAKKCTDLENQRFQVQILIGPLATWADSIIWQLPFPLRARWRDAHHSQKGYSHHCWWIR